MDGDALDVGQQSHDLERFINPFYGATSEAAPDCYLPPRAFLSRTISRACRHARRAPRRARRAQRATTAARASPEPPPASDKPPRVAAHPASAKRPS
jgi:hypothetical protein